MDESGPFNDSRLCPTKARLDKANRSEPSSGAVVRTGRASVRTVEGESGEAAARAQGEALLAIAHRLGLLDEKKDE